MRRLTTVFISGYQHHANVGQHSRRASWKCATELSPLSGSDTQCKITERTSYYPKSRTKAKDQTGEDSIMFSGYILWYFDRGRCVREEWSWYYLEDVRSQGWTHRKIMYINYLGDLFLRMLKSLILPLIISSLVSAIGSLDFVIERQNSMRAYSVLHGDHC